ncbi:hypothetical protein AX768_14380 [Burkholderia sp. PAMC 28687]|nr:hypothetical protein AX768_14380 [Burkholderia sp. PAMC 28687]
MLLPDLWVSPIIRLLVSQRGPPRKQAGSKVGKFESKTLTNLLTRGKRFYIISFLCCKRSDAKAVVF